MIWSDFRGAPAPGTVLASVEDVAEGQAMCLTLGAFSVLLTRTDGTAKAYVNACPHQFLPLDYRSDKVIGADGRTIRCSNHSAGFDAATGTGTEGFGQGCALVPIPIVENSQTIVIAVE